MEAAWWRVIPALPISEDLGSLTDSDVGFRIYPTISEWPPKASKSWMPPGVQAH